MLMNIYQGSQRQGEKKCKRNTLLTLRGLAFIKCVGLL